LKPIPASNNLLLACAAITFGIFSLLAITVRHLPPIPVRTKPCNCASICGTQFKCQLKECPNGHDELGYEQEICTFCGGPEAGYGRREDRHQKAHTKMRANSALKTISAAVQFADKETKSEFD